ncbi:ankyrin [Raccoonpox virus]|nr:ankyrin [Raccoonpox virus]
MSGMLSLSEYAIRAVRKLLYNIHLTYRNRINAIIKHRSTNNESYSSEYDYSYHAYDYDEYDYDSDSDYNDRFYDYNKYVRHKKTISKKFYCISKYKKSNVKVSSTVSLIDTIEHMIMFLENNGNNTLIDTYKSFIENNIYNKKNITYSISQNEDMDILYTYFKSSKYSIDLEPELVKSMIDCGIVNLNYCNKKTSHGILHAYLGNNRVDTAVLELLCNSGADINMKSCKFITPFHTYLRRSDACPNIARTIIELGGDIHCSYYDNDKMTPIATYLYTVRNPNPEMVKLFIELDGDNDKIQELLHLYISASYNIDIDIIKLFLKYIKKLDYKDKTGRTILHLYMLRCRVDTNVINLLHSYNTSWLNEPDNIGNTVLHTYVSLLSIISGNDDIYIDIIKHLISLGADITAMNNLKETPLTTYICTAQNYIYYDIIDCLMSDKVLNLVKHRILQDVLSRYNESTYTLQYLITKYNLDIDLFTDEYEPYDSTIDDSYHNNIISRYNNLLKTSGMTPLHVSIISRCDNYNCALSYLLSIQSNINLLTKKGLNCLELTIVDDDGSYCTWNSVEKILNKRPIVDYIVTFLNKCYDKGIFQSTLIDSKMYLDVLSLAIMLVGIDHCDRYISYMKMMNVNGFHSDYIYEATLNKLYNIRNSIDKLTKIYIDSRKNTTLYDLLVSKRYDIDMVMYKENSVIASFCAGTDQLCGVVRRYVSEARSNYYLAKDIINYLICRYPIIHTIPINELCICIIGIYNIDYFRNTIMTKQYNDIMKKLEQDES